MTAQAVSDMLQLVTFRIDAAEYALDILKVQEIDLMTEITAIPNAPPSVEGVINLRGKVIPVVDLRKKFGLLPKRSDSGSRIIIVDVGAVCGVVVDAVSEVLRVPAETVEPPPVMTVPAGSEAFVRGVAKLKDRLVILLDPDKLFGAEAAGFLAHAA